MTQLALAFESASFAAAIAAVAEPESFFVQSHMSVAEVEAGRVQAGRQEAAIIRWFQRQPAGERFTPSFVAAAFLCWPKTSIRRAMSSATRKGLLTHWPGDRRPGPHGASESVWSLA